MVQFSSTILQVMSDLSFWYLFHTNCQWHVIVVRKWRLIMVKNATSHTRGPFVKCSQTKLKLTVDIWSNTCFTKAYDVMKNGAICQTHSCTSHTNWPLKLTKNTMTALLSQCFPVCLFGYQYYCIFLWLHTYRRKEWKR